MVSSRSMSAFILTYDLGQARVTKSFIECLTRGWRVGRIARMLPFMVRGLLCSLALLLSFCARVAGAEVWTEVRSPHFRILTDGSAQQGRDVAAQFEQMRQVFAAEFNDPKIGAGAPLTIIAARDSSTFKMLQPTEAKRTNGNVAGEFHRGWEKQFATIILDSSDQSQVVVFHEYTHSILHARAHWLPVWLDEGLAEFYGYTRFEQNRTLIGTPSRRMGALQGASLLPVSEMLDTKNETKLLRDNRQANLFYAEAWAMVHYMMFGKGMENGARLNVFFQQAAGVVSRRRTRSKMCLAKPGPLTPRCLDMSAPFFLRLALCPLMRRSIRSRFLSGSSLPQRPSTNWDVFRSAHTRPSWVETGLRRRSRWIQNSRVPMKSLPSLSFESARMPRR